MTTFIEQEQQENYEDDLDEEPHFQKKLTFRSIFCSKIVKGVLVALVIAVVFPFLAYQLAIARTIIDRDSEQKYSCLVQQEYRIPCGYVGMRARECESVSCCFNRTTGECHHYLPSKYYYEISQSGDYYTLTTSREKSPVQSDMIQTIQFSTKENGKKLSLILEDAKDAIRRNNDVKGTTGNFFVGYSKNKLILDVQDQDNDTIVNTASGALIASENYWEWSFQFFNHTMFGLDQNIITLSGNQTLKKVIYKNQVDHNTQPVIWSYNKNKFYSFLVNHDGPLELTILASNIVIVKSLLGKRLEIQLIQGPSPKELYKNQMENVVISPKWSLGTHNCRKSADTELAEILKVYSSGFTFDSECLHDNLFLSLQKSTSSESDRSDLITALDKLQNAGTKLVLSLQPHIIAFENNTLYTDAQSLDILYKNSSGNEYQGIYLDLPVVYPDFTHPSIQEFISKLINWVDNNVGLDRISGFVLSENWPQDDSASEVDNSSFPYFSENFNKQMRFTLPWNLPTADGSLHMETHNLYGSLHYKLLNDYLQNNKNLPDFFIASASKSFGDNEPEISENFQTSWDYFRVYLEKMLFNSITGDYMVGLPICGDTATYNKVLHETLCLRWYIAAASMPYFRISSGNPYRDPSSLNTLYSTNIVKKTIERRKMFQDYFHTIINKGEPLIRPLYFDYYTNADIFYLESQYTIGEDIIVAHPLTSGRARLQVYLPPERDIWYEFWGGTMFMPVKKNKYFVEIDILETDWISFIAQGSIVALTNSKVFNIYIALNCSTDCTAKGDLFKDDTNLSFTSTGTSVTINNLPDGCGYTLGYVRYYGYKGSIGYTGLYTKSMSLCEEGKSSFTLDFVTDPS